LAEYGDESVPYPFLSQMAKVELSIVDAKKGNRAHIDLSPSNRSNDLRIDIPSAAMYKAAMYIGVRVR
jgi:hypothetical protein